AISAELQSAGVDLAAVEILCGEQGARILDEHGRYHGLRGRVVRTLQRLGYDETTLAIYDQALGDGDLLLRVPARPAELQRIAALLQRHKAHEGGSLGQGTSEQFPDLDTGCPGSVWTGPPHRRLVRPRRRRARRMPSGSWSS